MKIRIASGATASASRPSLPAILALALALSLAACGGGGGNSGSAGTPAAPAVVLSASAALGEKIFSDPSMSASGRQSCATCHDPAHAHGPGNDLAVQLGGADGGVPGFRTAPSLRYLTRNPAFFFDKDGTPTGGFNRDGRAQTLAAQAERPLLAPHEMANLDKDALLARLKKSAYAQQFQATFGAAIFDNAEQAFGRAAFALQQYQNEEPAFRPYDSKYDQFLAGKLKLADAELRGLALFNNPLKGNCAACHPSARGADGGAPLFTDFSFDNLGVPRNPRIPANGEPAYFDLGLCGPDRLDLAARSDLCGAFKVPTLRNVATRKVFFHNGAFSNLTDVLRFYVRRDTHPEEWYPLGANGAVDKFNDLPPPYRAYVNVTEVPYNRKPGMEAALSDSEIADVVSFLGTLNDGYRP